MRPLYPAELRRQPFQHRSAEPLPRLDLTQTPRPPKAGCFAYGRLFWVIQRSPPQEVDKSKRDTHYSHYMLCIGLDPLPSDPTISSVLINLWLSQFYAFCWPYTKPINSRFERIGLSDIRRLRMPLEPAAAAVGAEIRSRISFESTLARLRPLFLLGAPARQCFRRFL